MELTRGDDGQLVPIEPLCLWWSERDSPSAIRHGPYYAQPDIWQCRDHPDWRGEDIPESQIADWESRGEFKDYPGGAPRFWEEESIQAHALVHGFSIAESN